MQRSEGLRARSVVTVMHPKQSVLTQISRCRNQCLSYKGQGKSIQAIWPKALHQKKTLPCHPDRPYSADRWIFLSESRNLDEHTVGAEESEIKDV